MTTRTDMRIAGKNFRETITTRMRRMRIMRFIDGRAVSMEAYAEEIARARAIEAAVAELARFGTLAELCDACREGYHPTLRADLDPRFADIADAFDAEMARRGSSRRAFRG